MSRLEIYTQLAIQHTLGLFILENSRICTNDANYSPLPIKNPNIFWISLFWGESVILKRTSH